VYSYLKKLNLDSWLDIKKLKGDGSNRTFFRITFKNYSLILILPDPLNKKEAKNFYLVGKFLKSQGIPIPKIFHWEESSGITLTEDLGDTHLADVTYETKANLYPKLIKILVLFKEIFENYKNHPIMGLNPAYDFEFLWKFEVMYFFEWYVKKYKKLKASEELVEEVKDLIIEFVEPKLNSFIHRDFQSKNIMIKNGAPFVIDFQGARKGPIFYDLASLIVDPYEKNWDFLISNLNYYSKVFSKVLNLSTEEVKVLCIKYGILRLHQALAAYCKLSLKGKSWFKEFIPIAEKRLQNLLKSHFPKLSKLYKQYNIF